jgi:hypothetical protein
MSRWYKTRAGLGLLFQVGVRRRPSGWLAWLVTPFAALLAVWVVVAATVVIVAPWTLAVTVLTAMMTLAFLGVGARARSDPERPSPVDWLLSAAALASGIYFTIHASAIEARIALLDPLSSWDIVFASALFVLTLEITRRTTGLGLTLVVLIFVAYNLLGHRLGGVLQHVAFWDFRSAWRRPTPFSSCSSAPSCCRPAAAISSSTSQRRSPAGGRADRPRSRWSLRAFTAWSRAARPPTSSPRARSPSRS